MFHFHDCGREGSLPTSKDHNSRLTELTDLELVTWTGDQWSVTGKIQVRHSGTTHPRRRWFLHRGHSRTTEVLQTGRVEQMEPP